MNNKNIYLLIVGILCAALVCAVLIGLVGGFWTGDNNSELLGESTVNTTEAEPEKETQQISTNETEIDEPIDSTGTRPTVPSVTTGNGEEEDPTTDKTPEQTTGNDNDNEDEDDSDITIDLIPEPSEGEGPSDKPVDSTTPTDSKVEIDFNDF